MSPKKKTPNVPAKPAHLKSEKVKSTALAKSKVSKPKSNLGRVPVVMEEFILNINGTTDFQIQTLTVNPGYVQTFPYLSGVAKNFQFYRFKKLYFEYRPRSSALTTGIVGLSPEYNPEEQAPSTIVVASNMKGAETDVPYEHIRMHADVGLMFATGPHKSVRNYRGPESLLYDAMKVNIFGEGHSTTDVIGSLWVCYEVELWSPQFLEVLISPRLMSDYYYAGNQTITGLGTWQAIEVGNLYDPLQIGEQDATLEKNWKPPPGAYRITFHGTIVIAASSTSASLAKVAIWSRGLSPVALAESEIFTVHATPSSLTSSLPFYLAYNQVIVPDSIPGNKYIGISGWSNNGNAVIKNPQVNWQYA